MAMADSVSFRNIVLVFKLKMKGIAWPKLVPEAQVNASNTFVYLFSIQVHSDLVSQFFLEIYRGEIPFNFLLDLSVRKTLLPIGYEIKIREQSNQFKYYLL